MSKKMTEVQRKWRDENMEAIREGVKAVKEGHFMPADTFFEWMQAKYVRDIWDARIADLERQLEEAREKLEAVELEAQDWSDSERAWYCRMKIARILKEEIGVQQ